ncbi:hypothetical protein M6B38_132785 [Iris pallida]|uniref:Uncharacterized protein n=1 Tax=Iris pallida TaxID=29817 RepID=A0AAX6FIG8_IRIPA|nr:hypothetical protein M6B38_132785 [Iris pallida]
MRRIRFHIVNDDMMMDHLLMAGLGFPPRTDGEAASLQPFVGRRDEEFGITLRQFHCSHFHLSGGGMKSLGLHRGNSIAAICEKGDEENRITYISIS